MIRFIKLQPVIKTAWQNFFQPSTLIWLIMIGALICRLPLLSGSFWLDEAAQALESSRPLNQQFEITADFQPPLLHLIVHLATYLGHQEWWLRTVGALLPGLLTVYLTYLIGRQFHSQTGLLAATFLASSSFHIFYSQELRPYSLAALMVTASWYFLGQAEKNATDWGWTKFWSPANRWWRAWWLTNVLALFSSYLTPFAIAGQFGYLLFKSLSNSSTSTNSAKGITSRSTWGWLVLTSLPFLFWLPNFWGQLQAGQNLRRQLPGWDQVVSLTQLKALPLTIAKLIFGISDLELNGWFLGGAFILIGLSWWLITHLLITKTASSVSAKKQLLTLLIWWVGWPLISAWLVSFLIPVISPKRLMFILPGIYVLAAQLINLAGRSAKPWLAVNGGKLAVRQLGWALAGWLLLINLVSLNNYWTKPAFQRENWRQLFQEIQLRFPQSQTVVVQAFSGPFASWHWYNQGYFSTLALDGLTGQSIPPLAATQLKTVFNYQYVLIFDYLTDLTDPNSLIEKRIKEYGYSPGGIIDQPGIGFVRIYLKNQLLTTN